MIYEQQLQEDLFQWKKKLLRKSSMFERVSKKTQTKINDRIPEKVHTVITESIKKMVQATLAGSNLTTSEKKLEGKTLEDKEKLVKQTIAAFQKTAAVEGAGTGAGGIFGSVADFPLLLGIKMKCLFEIASLYGFDPKQYEERVFLLYVFQLAYSSDEHRRTTFEIIENWETKKKDLKEMDWKVFQQEYRDHIDLVKLLQIMPGIGAVVGGVANYHLVRHLGETAMNCYRIRTLK
ncbi:EcsC family protein [Bacillus sp. UMB0893]|uniref:EcsC family protein n=1 Tax=Bacillus sp. UMB0893 TaxID=2066053 RepID=UPI000C78D832|nr:EcsC family protein [Bacillus sp. UMB0893]PLR67439.1 ABC transporter-associated protein EcsC [Bacillus sp. UMB0893]